MYYKPYGGETEINRAYKIKEIKMAKEKSLLEQAKEIKATRQVPRTFTQEQIELVNAWVDDKVSLSQIQKVLRLSNSQQTSSFIAYCLKSLLQSNGHKK